MAIYVDSPGSVPLQRMTPYSGTIQRLVCVLLTACCFLQTAESVRAQAIADDSTDPITRRLNEQDRQIQQLQQTLSSLTSGMSDVGPNAQFFSAGFADQF